MHEDAMSPSRVALGFNGAWGFARKDMTSPALAAEAGALIDAGLISEPGSGESSGQFVTELRVHGVAGSDGPTMLEQPEALQVAGDDVTGFYRRWSPDGPGRPSVPRPLEAYSWGGMTEAPLASASWLLLAPFMMYNLAHFMLPPAQQAARLPEEGEGEPPRHLDTTWGHRLASGLLRLLALAATVQFVSAAAAALVSTVAWQAAGRGGMLPAWMGWYGSWTAGWRVGVAMLAVAVVVAALWWVSVATAQKYEARTSRAEPSLNAAWPLTQPGFWKGEVLVGRQRALHSAAALASVALIGALSAGRPAAAKWAAVIFAAVVLVAAAVLVVNSLAERYTVTLVHGGEPQDTRAGLMCRGVLAGAVAALVVAALVSGLTDHKDHPQLAVLPGLSGFAGVLLAVQAGLLAALAITVAVLASRARAAGSHADDKDFKPFLRGNLGSMMATLGVLSGGLLGAVVNFGVTRLIGTPVPSGFSFGATPPDALAVPWPIYAFGAEPIGLLAGAVAAVGLLWLTYVRHRAKFLAGMPSKVAAAYQDSIAKPGTTASGDDEKYRKNRRAIASAWAIGLLADDVAAAVAWVAAGGVTVVLAAEIAAAALAGPASHPSRLFGELKGLASLIAVLGVLAAGWLVTLLRQAYTSAATRKSIGALWDVATFWPRAVHPLAPPCYGERAVPELVDRIRLLTGHADGDENDVARLHAEAELPDLRRTRGLTVPAGHVMLTGYSQGSVIAPAVIAQLPKEVRQHVALLTLACPARRLYGRAFPAFFGRDQLVALSSILDADAGSARRGRWKNLTRRSDFIGSWIFAEPMPRLRDDDLEANVDQPSWDPVVLVQDKNPTPPPIHRHSAWWPDPRCSALGAYLVDLLADDSTYSAGPDDPEPEPHPEQPASPVPAARTPRPEPQAS